MTAVAKNLEKIAEPLPHADGDSEAPVCDLDAVRIPHVTIHAFRQSEAFGASWERAARDRRMANATTELHEGGFAAATAKYRRDKTPDLIVVETDSDEGKLSMETDALAEVCDPGTRVIVVGHKNDIHLYQKLLEMGISSYLVAPVGVPMIIEAISNVYREPGKEKIGKITAVIGAKGGVGASSVAQNLALELANQHVGDVVLVDLDLRFGTASLNLDVEPNQGLAELIDQAERMDAAMLDRVLVKRGLHLNVLGTITGLEHDSELDEFTIDKLAEVVQTHVPQAVLDIPSVWNGWVRRALTVADRVMVVSTPDICSLRNATAILAQLKSLRPNDPRPYLVLNRTGVPRSKEITAKDVRSILKIEPAVCIPFDPRTFSAASARGKLPTEVGPQKPLGRAYRSLAELLSPPNRTDGDTRKRPPQRRRGLALFSRS